MTASDGTQIGLWPTDSSAHGLLALCQAKGIPTNGMPHAEARQVEWLAERLLLDEMTGDAALTHDPQGNPRLPGSDIHISISHTRGMVVVALNDDHPIGIDIEHEGRSAMRVRLRFLHGDELEQITSPAEVLLAWTAKEAIYKLFGGGVLADEVTLDFHNPEAPTALCRGQKIVIERIPLDGHILTLAYRQQSPEPTHHQ